MAIALLNVFDVDVVQNIQDFIHWEEKAGYTMICKTRHVQTYSGGPEGGWVYFYKERRPGWYWWNRSWGREPCYAYTDDGIVAVKWTAKVKYIGVLPDNYEKYNW